MGLIEPYFTLSKNLPLIGGEWGPWVNGHITKGQKKQVFILFLVSLLLIIAFGAWAYYDDKKTKEGKVETCDPPKDYTNSGFDLGDFFNIDKLVDLKSLGVGMFSGIIFGFIDNGGLWFGMDSLDPVFDPSNVAWVYGYGGRKQFSGFDSKNGTVYKDVKFKDGKLENGQLKNVTKICSNMDKMYDNKINQIKKSTRWTRKEKRKQRNLFNVNEAAFADPSSELFLGANMTRKQYFDLFKKRRINQDMYSKLAETYNDYLNNKNLPKASADARKRMTLTSGEKFQKLKYKQELKILEGKNMGLPFKNYGKNGKRIRELKRQIRQRRVWPGNNKKLAQAWNGGWRPGSLTQAGIGNSFSDGLGAFLSTFAAILIVNATGIKDVSLISEAVGIILGCILGIIVCRTILKPLTYKT